MRIKVLPRYPFFGKCILLLHLKSWARTCSPAFQTLRSNLPLLIIPELLCTYHGSIGWKMFTLVPIHFNIILRGKAEFLVKTGMHSICSKYYLANSMLEPISLDSVILSSRRPFLSWGATTFHRPYTLAPLLSIQERMIKNIFKSGTSGVPSKWANAAAAATEVVCVIQFQNRITEKMLLISRA